MSIGSQKKCKDRFDWGTAGLVLHPCFGRTVLDLAILVHTICLADFASPNNLTLGFCLFFILIEIVEINPMLSFAENPLIPLGNAPDFFVNTTRHCLLLQF